MRPIGTHLVADIDGVGDDALTDREGTTGILVFALENAGFTVLEVCGHDFPGGGFTSVVLLSESHASLHSYPECGFLAFDLFSCGEKSPENVLAALTGALGEVRVRSTCVQRASEG